MWPLLIFARVPEIPLECAGEVCDFWNRWRRAWLWFPGRRGADGRLSSAQTALMLQEETIRRLERERKGLNEKIAVLDSSLAQAEGERRQLRDKVAQFQQVESKSDKEKEAMRAQIENAESRLTKVELRKRSLEGMRAWINRCNALCAFENSHLIMIDLKICSLKG